MMTLFIDTSLNDVIIVILKNGKLLTKETISGQKYNSQFIMPTIKKVLNEKMPNEVIVVNGPGSFTGVRLGVTIAKTFAYTLNIPIKTITSLEQIAFSLKKAQKIVTISDNNGHYIGIFDKNNTQVGEYKYLHENEYEEFSKKYEVISNVEFDYPEIYKILKNRDSINPHIVKPLYIKKISVEK